MESTAVALSSSTQTGWPLRGDPMKWQQMRWDNRNLHTTTPLTLVSDLTIFPFKEEEAFAPTMAGTEATITETFWFKDVAESFSQRKSRFGSRRWCSVAEILRYVSGLYQRYIPTIPHLPAVLQGRLRYSKKCDEIRDDISKCRIHVKFSPHWDWRIEVPGSEHSAADHPSCT